MFTRVTIQGSLVALQQHIRSKAPATTARERSHSLEDTATLEQLPLNVNDHHANQHSFTQYVAPAPVAVDYLGWGTVAAPANSTGTPRKITEPLQTQQQEESEEEVIISYTSVQDDAPSATYNFGSRDVVVHNVCSFLEIWVNSFKSTSGVNNACNPHGWECLRKQKAIAPSCHSNSSNNYNTAHASCGHPLHYVYGTTIPTISMKDYLMRLTEYFRTTDAVFIIATHYFSRIIAAYKEREGAEHSPIITPWSLHRVYFVCCVLAAKWLEDTPFDNQYYASVGGISTFELSNVETALLGLLDFNVFISRTTVDAAWQGLQSLASQQDLTAEQLEILALPQNFRNSCDSSLSQMSSTSSLGSHQLSVAATPFKPSVAAPQNPIPGNWYRATSAPMFPYNQATYGHNYNAYGYGQHYMPSIVGHY